MLNRWQRTIVDLRGNVVPYAQLQIRVESTQATATIYADRAGNELIPNGIVTADANGYAYFYAEADLYRISSMQPTIDWRYVDIGAAGALQRGNNLSDVTNPATARGNLGLGSAASADAVQSTGSSEHDVMSQKAVTDALDTKVDVNGNQTIGGIKAFSSFPITPTDAPTTNYQVANKKYVDDNAIGVGQTWQDVTSSRTAETTYTNTTGRTIVVSVMQKVAGSFTRSRLLVDGLEVSGNSSGANTSGTTTEISTAMAIVPAGSTYRMVHPLGNNFSWFELR